jgi:hypothetical protein
MDSDGEVGEEAISNDDLGTWPRCSKRVMMTARGRPRAQQTKVNEADDVVSPDTQRRRR